MGKVVLRATEVRVLVAFAPVKEAMAALRFGGAIVGGDVVAALDEMETAAPIA